MIPAFLHGKISHEQRNMEDLLTSNVFGLLQYVNPQDGLLPLLAAVAYRDGRVGVALGDSPVIGATITFWPWWAFENCRGAEPDVVIEFRTATGELHLLLVEAKFRSPKSENADTAIEIPNDQLAREWDNLLHAARKRGAVPHMVYLTADYGLPRIELEESAHDFNSKRTAGEQPFDCGWLSWRVIPQIFKVSKQRILEDLVLLLRHLGLTFFEGIRPIAPVPQAEWHFIGARIEYRFTASPKANANWRFEHVH